MSKPGGEPETARNDGRHSRAYAVRRIMASSTRPSITPRPCCTRRWSRWRTARSPIPTAAAARPPSRRSRTRSASSKAAPGPCSARRAFRPARSPCSASRRPATTSWSPTRSTARRAPSATRPSRASASTTTYYDPLIGGGDRRPVQARTRAPSSCESPGSLTFEVQDVPAIAAAAHANGHRRHPRQHLGDAAVLRRARPRRRHRRDRRDEIHRRPFRRDARHGHRERQALQTAARNARQSRPHASVPTTSISASAACARWPCA